MHTPSLVNWMTSGLKLVSFASLGSAILCLDALAQPVPNVPVPIEYFGLHIHRADVGTTWPNIPFGSWRLWDAYVGWQQLEPKRGQWDFSRLDKYVAMAALTKVDLLLPLAMTPQWASARPAEASGYSSGNAAEPRAIDDWRNYVEMVGTRYRGKIKLFEIWNEPNAKDHYTGNVEKLVELTCEAHRILKGIDPGIRIVSPAVVGATQVQYLDKFLSLGGKNCIDVVGYHFYVPKLRPEAMVPVMRDVREVMRRNGLQDKPLWNTETGWWIANGDGTPDHPMVAKGGWKKLDLDREAGEYLEHAFLLARAEGVERFYWYSWDNPYGLGMLDPTSGKPKPMVEAWRRTVSRLLGATDLKCGQNGKDWTCSFTNRTGSQVVVAWSSN